jgi:hypothetical protein
MFHLFFHVDGILFHFFHSFLSSFFHLAGWIENSSHLFIDNILFKLINLLKHLIL